MSRFAARFRNTSQQPNSCGATTMRSGILSGAAIVAGLSMLASPARAEGFVALGAGLERQNVVCAAGAPCERSRPAWRLAAGWRAGGAFGSELVYFQPFSAFTASDRNAALSWSGAYDVRVVGLTGTWTFPLFGLDWQARAGVASVRGTFDSRTLGVPNSSETRTRPLVGFGFRHDRGSQWTVRVDADVTDGQAYTGKGRTSLFTAGFERRF